MRILLAFLTVLAAMAESNTPPYALSSSSASFTESGGNGTILLTASANCSWNIVGTPSWVTILSGESGSGSSTVSYSVQINGTTSPRAATFSIAGLNFTVSQSAAPCTFSLSATSAAFGANGGNGSVNVNGASCAWTAVTPVTWISLSPASGGVIYSVATNASTASRCAMLTVAGITFTITQSGAIISTGGPWTRTFGSTGADICRAVASDGSGNVLAAGGFMGTIDLGTGPLTTAGASDLLIAKYSPTGTVLWAKRYGGAGSETVISMATDAAGNIFVTGSFTATSDFGGGPRTAVGSSDLFIAKYSPAGDYIWDKAIGGTAADSASSISITPTGEAVVTGTFVGTVDFGGGPLVSRFSGMDTFLAKYSATGAYVWAKNFPSDADDQGMGVAVDGSGNILLTARSSGSVDFGGGSKAGSVCVAKFNSAGGHLWSRAFTSPAGARPVGIAVDSSGNAYVVGMFSVSIDLGAGLLTTFSGSDFDVFLAKYSGADGAALWTKAFRGNGNETPMSVATDGTGNVAITGYFPFTVNLGGSDLVSPYPGTSAVFVAKYNTAGSHLASQRFGSDVGAQGHKMAIQSTGHMLVGGMFMGTADFRGQPFNSAGSMDGFVVRLDP